MTVRHTDQRLQRCLAAVIIFLGLSLSEGVLAEPAPTLKLPWMTPELIKAAFQMKLTTAQKPEYRRIVGDFLNNRARMIAKQMRRKTMDKKRSIRNGTQRLGRRMDKAMRQVLTDEQWPAYQNYREILLGNLKKSAY